MKQQHKQQHSSVPYKEAATYWYSCLQVLSQELLDNLGIRRADICDQYIINVYGRDAL
jgi:hypothetical protein